VACKEMARPAAPSRESMVPGMAMTATAFMVVATMTVFAAVGWQKGAEHRQAGQTANHAATDHYGYG
jgi:hypothetical protein